MYRSGLLNAVDGDDIKKNLATMAVRLQCNSFNLVTWWLMVWYGQKCGGFSMDFGCICGGLLLFFKHDR